MREGEHTWRRRDRPKTKPRIGSILDYGWPTLVLRHWKPVGAAVELVGGVRDPGVPLLKILSGRQRFWLVQGEMQAAEQ
eukprot:103703-Amphidinium_carterae.1